MSFTLIPQVSGVDIPWEVTEELAKCDISTHCMDSILCASTDMYPLLFKWCLENMSEHVKDDEIVIALKGS